MEPSEALHEPAVHSPVASKQPLPPPVLPAPTVKLSVPTLAEAPPKEAPHSEPQPTDPSLSEHMHPPVLNPRPAAATTADARKLTGRPGVRPFAPAKSSPLTRAVIPESPPESPVPLVSRSSSTVFTPSVIVDESQSDEDLALSDASNEDADDALLHSLLLNAASTTVVSSPTSWETMPPPSAAISPVLDIVTNPGQATTEDCLPESASVATGPHIDIAASRFDSMPLKPRRKAPPPPRGAPAPPSAPAASMSMSGWDSPLTKLIASVHATNSL